MQVPMNTCNTVGTNLAVNIEFVEFENSFALQAQELGPIKACKDTSRRESSTEQHLRWLLLFVVADRTRIV